MLYKDIKALGDVVSGKKTFEKSIFEKQFYGLWLMQETGTVWKLKAGIHPRVISVSLVKIQ